MKVELKDKERIDDLQRNGYQIIQNPEKFCFGMDAVLLTGFAYAREKDILLDLGTGTGIIPLLMEAKYHCSHLTGLEIPRIIENCFTYFMILSPYLLTLVFYFFDVEIGRAHV